MDAKLFYISCLFISSAITLGFSIYAFIRLRNTGAVAFAALMLAITFYSLGYALELYFPTLPRIILFLKIEYIGIATLPVFWLILAMQYTGIGQWLSRTKFAILFTIPVITLILHYTNAYHHLFYRDLGLNTEGPFPLAAITKGIWYYINIVYTNLLIVLGNVLFFRMIFRTSGYFRKQAITIFAGSLFPWIGNIIYQLGLSPYGIDINPLFLTITGPLFGLSMFGYQMFDLTPIARNIVFSEMKNPVIVLDNLYRIADFNNAAGEIFDCLNKNGIGSDFNHIFHSFQGLSRQLQSGDYREFELEITCGDDIHHFTAHPTKIEYNSEIIGNIITFQDITANKAMLEKLRSLATIDELTNILNRRHFIEVSNDELIRARRYKKAISILMIDLDFFKRVNDTYGHSTGDLVLNKAADTFQECLRSNDILGRYGGEEFSVLLPETDFESALHVAERLRQTMESMVISTGKHHINITISIGLYSVQQATSEMSLESLLQLADKALYKAKDSGRNRVETV